MNHYRGRDIPWLPVVQFHKEVVTRAEEGFFSLYGRDDQAERWTSLPDFEPDDLAGPWQLRDDNIRSQPFRLNAEQGQHESLFLGGPCYLGWTKSMRGAWMPQWRPLLYREVELRVNGSHIDVVPKEGSWSFTPLLYGLFDRLSVNIGESLDELAARLIEKAAGYRQIEPMPLERAVLKAFFAEVPDAEDDLTKAIRDDTFDVLPTPWVLFAPTNSFSALTRHLMRDYERLESILDGDHGDIGGLRLLEDQPASEPDEEVDVLPLVPLNDSQRSAVQHILEARPLTVISGPPGTGKSQVVVSLLLNAWARGQTVLFASNNNKAVDVVRERVERFESEFPIAVRAGARKKQNIQEVLRRTLNMASTKQGSSQSAADVERLRRQRQRLLDERRELLEALESKLPQRIDESRKTALHAYGVYRSTLAEIDEKEARLRDEQDALGFEGINVSEMEVSVETTRGWLEQLAHFQTLIREDDTRRQEIQTSIHREKRLRNRAVEEVGLAADDAGDWKWLVSGPSPELLADWECRTRALLEMPVEQGLEPVRWESAYDQWRSAAEAEKWASDARRFAETVRRTCAELATKLQQIKKLAKAVESARSKISHLGMRDDADLPADHLHGWAAAFAEYTTLEPGQFDFLPWSRRLRLRRRLRQHESNLRPHLPLKIWTQIGSLDTGREQLAVVVELIRRWIDLRAEWHRAKSVIKEIESRFQDLRSQGAGLKLRDIPNEQNTEAWAPIVDQCEKTADTADAAAAAWKRRTAKEEMEQKLRSLAKEWAHIASGVPIREAFRRGQGASFDDAMRNLADTPSVDTVSSARAALYTGTLTRLIENWKSACDHEQSAGRLSVELAAVPESGDRVGEWWRDRPDCSFVLHHQPTEWPDTREAYESIAAVEEWCAEWRTFESETRPEMAQKAQKELKWAIDKLMQAIAALPSGDERTQVKSILDSIRIDPASDWPMADLNAAFAAFSPERIRAKIDRIEVELEKGSFADAKAKWLERIRADDDAIRAVDRLEKSLRQYKGAVVESEHGAFRTALRAVPIWITTAQAPQAIPLEPELFDIVVIDEASQCTLTNLLPLMYRGKTLTVIGDDNQLPAIPTIQEREELALAKKYEIEEHLSLVGHATNDVYKTATESLPRRRADVLMLDEHFRSHPQVIGFSNRHIYLQRLELKKDPSWGKRLPVASGVHMMSIAGSVKRGPRGRSWINAPEAEAVVEQIKRLRHGDARSLSLGVVTPFAAQKQVLRDRLDEMRLASEVLVDTAYGFQGDERDVIIFSPVVAKGITASASRWVESPPNLINVAITRAREALFVMGDIDYCLQQEGILRKLAIYCKEIQLLRDTSEAELELFSWMMVQGWEPKVHPHVGDVEVDFVLQADNGDRLAIEVDGKQHQQSAERDKARDAYLQGQGYVVFRISAREVLETPFDVIHRIAEIIQEYRSRSV